MQATTSIADKRFLTTLKISTKCYAVLCGNDQITSLVLDWLIKICFLELCVCGAEEDLGTESSQTTRTYSTGNHGCCARCVSGGSIKGHETRTPRTVWGPSISQKCWCTPNPQIETPWPALNENSSPFPRSQICIASSCLRERWTTTSDFRKGPFEMSLPSAEKEMTVIPQFPNPFPKERM